MKEFLLPQQFLSVLQSPSNHPVAIRRSLVQPLLKYLYSCAVQDRSRSKICQKCRCFNRVYCVQYFLTSLFLFILACGCSPLGTLNKCDPITGKCTCKRFVEGKYCDRCAVSTNPAAVLTQLLEYVAVIFKILFRGRLFSFVIHSS